MAKQVGGKLIDLFAEDIRERFAEFDIPYEEDNEVIMSLLDTLNFNVGMPAESYSEDNNGLVIEFTSDVWDDEIEDLFGFIKELPDLDFAAVFRANEWCLACVRDLDLLGDAEWKDALIRLNNGLLKYAEILHKEGPMLSKKEILLTLQNHGSKALVKTFYDDSIQTQEVIKETRETIRKAELADKYRKALEDILALPSESIDEEIYDANDLYYNARLLATEALEGGDTDE